MKKMLTEFATGFLMLTGMLTFLVLAQEFEDALRFWIRIGGMSAFLIGLDWRITTAIRRSRSDV
ncbi:hypothetical protein ACIP5T_03275 [Microbacterium sp. NPDC088619]|uniref:hypothetical protein n=1 Tax=Microbacterium sp. NPDC088619 TaxID=3364196 RepID=UPI0037FA7F68